MLLPDDAALRCGRHWSFLQTSDGTLTNTVVLLEMKEETAFCLNMTIHTSTHRSKPLPSEPVFDAAEELAESCALHTWFGGRGDELEVKSMIAESWMPLEINRRRNTPHQASIFQTHSANQNTTRTIILYEATWQERVPRMQWNHARIYSRSIHSIRLPLYSLRWSSVHIHVSSLLSCFHSCVLAPLVKTLLPNHPK